MEKNDNLNEAFLEVLAESPLFREIEKKELRAMLVCLGGQIKEYKKGTSIFLWGDKISKIGFVLKGNVHVLHETYWGKESLLGRIGPGDLFGEVYACLPDLEFDGTVVAQTDYLCVDRSAMTVELYKLKDEGILDFDKNKFTLLE